MEKLNGNKTYLVAGVTIVYALSSLFLGKMEFAEAMNYFLAAGATVGFRSALKK